MTYSIPADLAWVLDQTDESLPVLYLMHVPDGGPLVLTETAALIWIFAVQGDDVVAELAEVVENPPADLAQMATDYLADLVARGLLVEAEAEPVGHAEPPAADPAATTRAPEKSA